MCSTNIINYSIESCQGLAIGSLLFHVFVSHPHCYQIAGTATIDADIESVLRVGFAADFSIDHKFVHHWAVFGGKKDCESETGKGLMTVKKYLL